MTPQKPHVRGVFIAIALLFAGALATACSPEEISLFNSLSPGQQQAVLTAHVTHDVTPTDCYGAIDRIWPASSRSWARTVMFRESRNNPRAQNRSSSAAGCFQILSGTWAANAACPWSQRYDAMCNTRTALNLYQRAGTSPWRLTSY